MRRHATEPVRAPDRTLCGEPMTRTIDNAAPNCGRCLRVIRSRCPVHNVRRCRSCTDRIAA